MGRLPHAPRSIACALAALALGSVARADGVIGQAQESYSNSDTVIRDESGNETRTSGQQFNQQYRLSLDSTLFPLVALSAGGVLDWTQNWGLTEGLWTHVDDKKWAGYARLKFGNPVLNGGIDYDYHDEKGESQSAGVTTSFPGVVREALNASLGWRPVDLPSLDLRLGRTNAYDHARNFVDLTSTEAQLAARDRPTAGLDLFYTIRYSDLVDRHGGVEATDITNSAGASYGTTYLDGRGSVYLNYSGTARSSDVSIPSRTGNGTVATQQLPIAGLSIVEAFPATPDHVTLNPNAALTDGEMTASAGVNIGFSASLAGDVAPRDFGGQFANVLNPVNTLYVWVDRTLPPAIAGAFSWIAYQSDDNLNWTPLPLNGVPAFSLYLNRFEIPIQETRARYLKIVTRPLTAAVTTDAQYREIFVTEIQFYEVVPASQVVGHSSSVSGSLNASNKLVLLRDPDLRYDVSALVSHSSPPVAYTWSVTNGLSLTRRLSRIAGFASRVDRTDADFGAGHEALNRWSAALALDPLPTLGGSVSYNGQLSQRPTGVAVSNGLGVTARADLYQGVGASANYGYTIGHDEAGATTTGTTVSGGLSLVPGRTLSMTATVGYSETEKSGGGQPPLSDHRGLLDFAASFSPFRALALGGTLTRFFAVAHPSTLATFNGAFSPFAGGSLSLRYSYAETLDTGADLRTRVHGPGARWNIRTGWYLDVAYSLLYTKSPSETVDTRSLLANLLITFR